MADEAPSHQPQQPPQPHPARRGGPGEGDEKPSAVKRRRHLRGRYIARDVVIDEDGRWEEGDGGGARAGEATTTAYSTAASTNHKGLHETLT